MDDIRRVLLPVSETPTLRETVSWLVNEFDPDEVPEIHLVYIATWRGTDPDTETRVAEARDILDQAARFVEIDYEDRQLDGSIESTILGDDTYLFGPEQYASVLEAYAARLDIPEIVLDPQYIPAGNSTLLEPLEFELSQTNLSVREARVTRPSRPMQFLEELTTARFATVFALALGFYLVLGEPTYWFDLVTGVASATIVATVLGRISLDTEPTFPDTPIRIFRHVLYVPVLLLEIIRSNIAVSRVILSPSLPIEPRLTRMRVRVGSGFPLLTLANSITLTPGTLTVRASDADLYVHTLIPWAREGLFDGSLERWTRFIYYGRRAAQIPSPRDREDCTIFQGSEATEPLPGPLAPDEAQTDGGTPMETSEMETLELALVDATNRPAAAQLSPARGIFADETWREGSAGEESTTSTSATKRDGGEQGQ